MKTIRLSKREGFIDWYAEEYLNFEIPFNFIYNYFRINYRCHNVILKISETPHPDSIAFRVLVYLRECLFFTHIFKRDCRAGAYMQCVNPPGIMWNPSYSEDCYWATVGEGFSHWLLNNVDLVPDSNEVVVIHLSAEKGDSRQWRNG